ncbi:MAG TPA: hypothetical protein VK179_10295 [Bacteroidales bacterium]|nr:hypothetical protein [Bacteroidales bacterium]
MKYLFFPALLFLQVTLLAQTAVPPEKVFVQTDRNVYTISDTIHFRAYISNFQNGRFEAVSTSLYCLLFDPYGRTADSARFRLNKSAISGWLTVPLHADTGIYTLVSFTSSMTNADPEFAFRTSIKITRRTTSPKNNKPTITDHKSSGISDLRFYPEGGNLIYGEPQLIAFTSVDSTGRFQPVDGNVFNGNNDLITHFKTDESGAGIFQINPDSSENYYAVVNGNDGRKWSLPVAGPGVCLSVTNTFRDLFYVQVRSNLNINPANRLLLIQNCDTVLIKELPSAKQYRTTIETSKLVPGMANLVLADQQNRMIAWRSVFVNYYKLLNLEIKSSENREKNLIKIKPESQADSKSEVMLTVSVMDSAGGFDCRSATRDIVSSFLFTPGFYESLPESITEKGLFSLDPKSIDELLMVFQPGRDTLMVSSVNKNSDEIQITYTGRQDIQELTFMVPQTASVLKFKPDNNKLIIQLDSIDPAMQDLYLLKSRKIRDFDSLKVDYLANEAYFKKLKRDEFKSKLALKINDSNIPKTTSQPDDDAIYFNAVTVKAKRKNLTAIDPHEMFPAGNVKTYSREDIEHCQTFESMLWKLHPLSINRAAKTVLLRFYPTFTKVDKNALFVVDGNRLGQNYLMIEDMPVENIESISVLRGQLGYNVYGVVNGIIFIKTRYGVNGYGSTLRANSPKAIPVFRNQSSPGQSSKSLEVKEADNPTLIWADEVMLKNGETCTVNIPASIPRGTYVIRVNAVSMDHSAGSAMYYFRK